MCKWECRTNCLSVKLHLPAGDPPAEPSAFCLMAPFPVGLSSQPCLPIVTGDRGFTLLGEWEGASVSTFVICHQTLYPTLVTTLHSPVSPSSLSKKARATHILLNTHVPSCLSLLDSWELSSPEIVTPVPSPLPLPYPQLVSLS